MGQTLYTFNGGGTSGDWDAAYSWTTDPTGSTSINARVPNNGDNVVITNSFVLSVRNPVVATGLNVTVQKGGVLDLTNSTTNQLPSLASLGGQGTLRIAGAYFPAVGTNNFDDANTGTVEFYNWPAGTATLPQPASNQYNNLRLLNTGGAGTAYTAQLGSSLTLAGNLTLTRTNSAVFLDSKVNNPYSTPALAAAAAGVSLTLGKTASTNITLTALGDLNIGAGTFLGVTAVNGSHAINLSGSFINNGTVNLRNGITNDNQVAALKFTGATDANFACNGDTDLDIMTVDKGIDSQVLLNVTSTQNVHGTSQGNLRFFHFTTYIVISNSPFVYAGVRLLALVNGNVKLGNNIYLPKIHNLNLDEYGLGSTTTSPTLWIAGATVINDNAALIAVYGTFRMSGGSFSGITDGGMVVREDGQVIVEGGTVTVNKFRPSRTSPYHRGSFIMSGGVFDCTGVNTTSVDDRYARFSVPYVTQSFRMTGGTIRVQRPNSANSGADGLFHIGVNPNNAIITGGTIELVLPNSNLNGKVLTTAPLWNLTVKKPVAGGTSKALLANVNVDPLYQAYSNATAQPLTVLGALTLDATNPTVFDAAGLNLTVQGTFTIGTGCTYLPGTNTTIFSGTQDKQFLANNGTIGATAGEGTFYNWTIDKAAGTLILSGTVATYNVPAAAKLSLLQGVLDDGGKTVRVYGDMVNSSSHTSGGGSGSIVLSGAALQTLSGDGTGVFGNLKLNSTMAAGAVAAQFTASMSVSNQLTLQSNHILSIGAYRLSLTNVSSAAITAPSNAFSDSRFIQTAGNQSDLGLQRTYGGPNTFLFPVGTGTKYTPASITLALATALSKYGQVSVSPANMRNPFMTGSNNGLKYYWKVRSVGFGTIPNNAISATFTMKTADAATAGNTTGYVPGFYTASTVKWKSFPDPNLVSAASSTADINFSSNGNGILSAFDGEYTAGVAATAFGAVTAYYSRGTGSWETPATWSTDQVAKFTGAAASAKPGPGNPVFIGSAAGSLNHYITVTANAATAGSLVIENGSTLDVKETTGHNFGALPDAKVNGSGLLRVSSSTATPTFPGGDFGSFLLPGGGTVEYYTNATQNITLPTVSGSLSLVSYRSLWLSPAAGRTITMPDVNLRVYEDMKTGVSGATTGIVSLNGTTARTLQVDNLLNVQYGTLRFANGTAQTLVFNKDVQVDAGATFDMSGAGAAVTTNTVTIAGSLTNNGKLDFNATSKALLTFTGIGNTKLTGTNATAPAATNLYTLTVNKGTSRVPTLTVDVASALTTPTNSWLTLTNGTLSFEKAGGTLNIHDADTPFVLTDNAGLTVNHPTATVNVATGNGSVTDNGTPANNTSATSDLKLAGELRALQGTLNVGTTTGLGNDIEYAAAGAPTIRVATGGTLNVNGQIRRNVTNLDGSLRYEQTGGTVDIAGIRANVYQSNERGLFEVQGPASVFRMSGGDLKLRRSNQKPLITTADLYLAPDSTVVTGGTVHLGNTTAGVGNVKISVNSAVSIYDLVVESGADATNTNTGFLTGTNQLSLKGSLTIGNVNSFFNANGIGLNIDQNLVNNNTLANATLNTGGFQPFTTTQTTTFTGKGLALQQLTSAAGNLTVFGSLVVNNAQTNGTLQLGGNAQVAGTLTLSKGTLADNGKTITVLGDVLNSAIHTSTGAGSLTLGGSANQNVGGSGLGKFGNLTLNNAAGATTTADQEVTNVLTLTNGVLSIGSNLLALSNTASNAITGTFSTTRCIRTNGIVADLGVRKSFPTGASTVFTFPVGAAVVTKYTPVQITVASSSSAGTITVQPIDIPHPSTTDVAAKELSYYWKVSSTGLASPTVTQVFTYYDLNSTSTDVNGDETKYVLGRFLSGAWVPVGGIANTVAPTANTLTNTNATYIDGDYTGGESSEFGTVPTFYSRNSTAGKPSGASWTDPLAWTINSDGSDPTTVPTATPTLANPVVIFPGHLITVTSPSTGRGAATLKLDGTLDLGANLANNFNTVTGTGTLRIGSAIFPAGNYANFVAASTGTVEFTQAVQLPARDTYNNLTLSGVDAVNTTRLTNLELTINGTLNIAANTKVDNLTSQSITLTSATSGAIINGALNLNDGKLTTGATVTTGSSSVVTLGASPVVIGTSLTNGGTINQGSGLVTVNTSLTNTGTYNAKAGTGNIAVGTAFSNSGTYTAGVGNLNVATTLTNTSTGRFKAGSGEVNAGTNFVNTGAYTATTNNLVHVNGDFSNLTTTGSFDAANSNVILRGNFNNTGTFTAGTSLVQFLTDVNRLLTGTTYFYDLQKFGGSSLTFGPNTDVHVADVLTIQNSIIYTGSANTNILYLDNATIQPIVGNTLTSYVSGRLAMALPNDVGSLRVFPVGAGQRYRPVTIKQLGLGSADPVVLVEVINGKPAGSVDPSLSNLSANRYYRIQLLSGTIDQPSIQLSFNTDVKDEDVNVPGNLRVAYAAGPITSSTTWYSAGGSGVFSPDAPKGYTTSGQFSTTIDGTSFFALGSTNSVDNPLTGVAPLPVELVQFSAVRQGSNVQVAWATASEKNSDYFAVERSVNGQYFAEIARVNAHGSTTFRHDYGTLDTAPLAGLSYYRLRQVDLDGKFAYSPVATVRFDGKPVAPSLLAYPNPATGTGFQLAALNLGSTGGTVRLLDGLGRVVFTQTVTAGSAETTIQPTKALASGMYIATWTTPEGLKLTTKVAVE
jgi:fibronectin-binding autotransporter adhesin